MTVQGNLKKVECPYCDRSISETNLSKHVAVCVELTKSELRARAWRRAAEVLGEEMDNCFDESAIEVAIVGHIRKVIIPFLAKKGRDIAEKGSKKLIPPDLKRCQGESREGSFMTFGPRSMVRCEKAPVVIATELKPGPDGMRGSMSLCQECLEVFKKAFPDRARFRDC